MVSLRKIVFPGIAAYFVLGLLTLLHWEFVWNTDQQWKGLYGRANATILFGPYIVATWPAQWGAYYRLGTWSWFPALAAAIFLIGAVTSSQAAPGEICRKMKPTDTLILHGRKQRAEHFLECTRGHWPTLHFDYRMLRPALSDTERQR